MGVRFDRAGLLRRVAAGIDPRGGSRGCVCGLVNATATYRSRLGLGAAQWIAGLPALGDVLYLSGDPLSQGQLSHGQLLEGRLLEGDGCRSLREPPLSGVLVESIELAPLLHTRALAAASAITADGPREWIECLDAGDRVQARLYLLPDTDYLAWDALHVGAGPALVDAGRAGAVPCRSARARLLRFRVHHVAGLLVLGAETGVAASPLGRELAARIARDEAVSR